MVSKIVGIGLTATLAAALIGGGAYILLRPDEAARGSTEQGRSTDSAYGGGGPWRDGGDGPGTGTGCQGRGNGTRPEDGGDHPVETWSTVTGEVIALDEELTIVTDEGESEVHLGPSWYWEAQGLVLEVGDRVAVSGFAEDGEFMAGRVENLDSGESVALRDETGRPLWTGSGGARGSRGSQSGQEQPSEGRGRRR